MMYQPSGHEADSGALLSVSLSLSGLGHGIHQRAQDGERPATARRGGPEAQHRGVAFVERRCGGSPCAHRCIQAQAGAADGVRIMADAGVGEHGWVTATHGRGSSRLPGAEARCGSPRLPPPPSVSVSVDTSMLLPTPTSPATSTCGGTVLRAG
jgi:hypothetical protein